MKRVEHLNQQGFTPASPLYQFRLWCDRNRYKYVLPRQKLGVGSASDLNSNNVQAHAMVISQRTVGDADRTGIGVVQSGVIAHTTNISVPIIVNLQSTDLVIQYGSNLANSSILTDGTVNSEQHSNGLVSNFLVTRNQIDKRIHNVLSIHISGYNTQVASPSIRQSAPAASCTSIHIGNINITTIIKVSNRTNTGNRSASSTKSSREVDNSSAANVLSSSVQSSLQIIAVAHGNLNIGQIAQSGFKHCRLTSCRSSSRGGSRILGLPRSSVASGQHADSHDAGQSQRSNLLEFHNDFFLLMVYKR